MSNRYKVFISVLAIISSVIVSALGAGFVGGSGISFSWKLVCNSIFMIQATLTVLCVIGLFRK